MSDEMVSACVLLSCAERCNWAVPQACLGEIVTLSAADDHPPAEIRWRGESVPVLDFGSADRQPWRDARTGSGLVAVLLGRRGQGHPYWGVAVRGAGLGARRLAEADIEDVSDAVQDYAVAAFRLGEIVYQVPDLVAIQRDLAARCTQIEELASVQQMEQ